MNYGRYFKLNQVVSKVVDGVTVYDYIDLPAFFGPSKDTPQTPKYPVSVVITADAVRFRLHYSSYKYGPEEGNVSRTVYRLNMEDVISFRSVHYHLRRNQQRWQSRLHPRREKISALTTVHMEEVIMELPFVDTHLLAENIREVYDTYFPMSEKYSGRYFHQVLRRRYKGEKCPSDVETNMYGALREKASMMLSYSQLECMGVNDEKIYVGKEVKRFLRKLLLDFLFDLRHSDIFQLNPHYRQMLSGLMSDYYFASLLHKCEYYYQRELVNSITLPHTTNGENGPNGGNMRFVNLYCKDFFRAEDHWMHDIMDIRAEEAFKPNGDGGQTWFEYPEKEMRAICFENDGGKKECGKNTGGEKANDVKRGVDALITVHNLRKRKNINQKEGSNKDWPQEVSNMVKTHDHNREAASRWFLRRYDFKDVFRLHLREGVKAQYAALAALVLVCLTFSIPAVAVEVPIVLTLVSFVCMLVVIAVNTSRRHEREGHFIASLHLVMPRLVAAIATAWFSLALCYELVIAVYRMPPFWVVVAIVLVVLAVFSLYKINLFVPNAPVKSKFARMGLFLLLSYFISIVIGFIIMACVGEPFLMEFRDTLSKLERQSFNYEDLRHGSVLVFRELTITFSFVAMFIGVFIQMIVGEEKQMTEM